MLTFRVGAAGSASAAKKMAEHLVTQTLPETAAALAAYYQRAIGAEGVSAFGDDPQATHAVQPGTRPEPRRDMDPRLAALLGIDLTRSPTQEEIANLLGGQRSDGAPIPGKQYQKATLPLAEIFGLDPLRAPSREELAHILDGRRADGVALAPEEAAAALVRLRKLLGAASGKALSDAERAEILVGRSATGEAIGALAWRRILSASKAPIGYVDFTFSADKSVSLAWAFAPTEAERNAIAQAHRDAVHRTMLLVAETVGQARKGQGGRGGAEPGAIGWISFDHYAARPTLEIARTKPDGTVETALVTVKVAGDPQLHTHVAVPNAVLTQSGRIGSLDTMRMHHKIHEWGAIYQAHLAQNLRTLGAKVVLDERLGAARLAAIPDAVRDAFSKRTRDAAEDAKRFAAAAGMKWERMAPEERIKLFKSGAFASRIEKGDDLSDFASWQRQLAALGYRHKSVLDPARPVKTATAAERLAQAYETGARLLAQAFERRAVIGEADARVAAARALIATGIDSAGDVDRVRQQLSRQGLPVSGAGSAPETGVRSFTTQLIEVPVAHNDGQTGADIVETRITTRAHLAQETALIALAKKHAADRSDLLDHTAIDRAVADSGLTFAGAHGRVQRRLIDHLGTSGRFAVAIGAAGAGKTALLRPLVAAWHAEGADIHGLSLGWRQARDLAEAGLHEPAPAPIRGLAPAGEGGDSVAATSVFIDRVKSGRFTVSEKSVVVIDELATIGTRQLLELLRLQDRYGFRMVAIGDPKQCQAIEAGFVTRLLEKALGPIPTIETSVRQTDPRSRQITELLRQGEASAALDMKREDGTAEIVPGGYRDTVARAAALWHERRAANAGRVGYALTVSAPTNDDARAIGEAIRARLQTDGSLGRNRKIVEATDPNSGADYRLPIAIGDQVRLFARTNAKLAGGQVGAIGDNGSIVEVRSVRHDGLLLRNAKGTEGFVRWETFADPRTGRLRLTYGYAMTTNTAQGITSTEHIFVTPRGSQTTDGHRSYVSGSRHRERDYWLTSEGAEKHEVVNRRPLGDPRPVGAADLWMNWARNLSRAPEKLNATDLVQEADAVRRRAAQAFVAGMARLEQGGDRDALRRQWERGSARRQAAASGLVDAFIAGNRQGQQSVDRLSRVAGAVHKAVAVQFAGARPLIERASAGVRWQFSRILRTEVRRTENGLEDEDRIKDRTTVAQSRGRGSRVRR